jgi:hypothetical protein
LHPIPVLATPVRLKHTKESVGFAVMQNGWRGEHIARCAQVSMLRNGKVPKP